MVGISLPARSEARSEGLLTLLRRYSDPFRSDLWADPPLSCPGQRRRKRHAPGLSTILVVDDDAPTRVILRMVLENAGHEVVEAAHGAAALDIIGPDLLPDIVMTDLTMPNLSGKELIERLRSAPRTASIPIVVVSGNYDSARTLQASGLVEAVIDKPFDAADLTECIRAVASTGMRSRPTSPTGIC